MGRIWPQLTAIVVLVIALIIGLSRLAVGTADGTGTLVNTAWVLYDLVVLSVIIQAARYRGPAPVAQHPADNTSIPDPEGRR